jgi:hypothetical protein
MEIKAETITEGSKGVLYEFNLWGAMIIADTASMNIGAKSGG